MSAVKKPVLIDTQMMREQPCFKVGSDFFNKATSFIDKNYFPDVKYYRDDDNCRRCHHVLEDFSNGVLAYDLMIKRLSFNLRDTKENIHAIISQFVESFGEYEYKPKKLTKKHTVVKHEAIKDFKDHWRLMCDDTWEDAKDAWMEGAGHMYNRGLRCPDEWKYEPSVVGYNGSNTDEDSAMHYHYTRMGDATLVFAATFMFRYCRYLQHKGCNPDVTPTNSSLI